MTLTAGAQAQENNSPAAANTSATHSNSAVQAQESLFYFSIAGAIDIPTINWQSAYSLGGGGSLALGYELLQPLAVELDVDNLYFAGNAGSNNITDAEWRVLPIIRYTLTGSDIRPYVLEGMGIDIDLTGGTQGNGSSTSFDLVAGIGMEWKAAKGMYVFVEGRWNFLVASGPNNTSYTGQDIPVLAGMRVGL